jgi:cytochrome P450
VEPAPGFCPYYPRPAGNFLVRWWRQLRADGSLLNALTERSYRMKMGDSRVGRHRLCVVNDPAAVRRILVERTEDYPKHRYMADLLEPLLGDSVFTSNGARWRRQRAVVDQAFQSATLDMVFPLMLSAVQAMLRRFEAMPDGSPCAIDAEMAHVTADVILRTIFSATMEGADAREVFDAFESFQRLAPKATMPRYRPGWLALFSYSRPSRQAAARIRALLAGLVRPRLLAHRSGRDAGSDLLAALLAASDAPGAMPWTLEELVDVVAVLFLAGHETSASALSWAWYLLANAPQVQSRLADEALAGLSADAPQLRDIRSLDLAKRVLRETLRLFPPIGFLVREAAATDEMRGKRIEPGATMVVSPWLIHRHRLFWERPDEFDPDRFLGAAGIESARSAYLPFSMGPRVCAGAGFAQQEATLVLAMLARRFRFEPVPGHVPVPVARLTTRSSNGVLLRVFRRATAATAA